MKGEFGKRETPVVRESPEELIARAKEEGSLNLALLSHDERKEVLRWYRKYASGENEVLEYEEATDFLEEFILYGVLDDKEVRKYIDEGNVDARRLGTFLGETVEPGRYLTSFYKCWWALDPNSREEFIHKFTKEHPEHAEMVVPFVDLTHIYTKEPKEGYNKSVGVKTILDVHFKRIEDAKRLIEGFLAYYDTDESLESRMSMGTRFRSPLIDHYITSTSIVLQPYLGELYDRGFITEKQVETLLSNHTYSAGRSVHTQEEEQEMKTLEKRIEKLGRITDPNMLFYIPIFELSPRKDVIRLYELRDRGQLRMAEHVLKNFDAQLKKFHIDGQKFLIECIEWHLPVFAFVDRLGLNKKEVGRLIARARSENGELPLSLSNLEDLKQLLRFNEKHKDEEGVDLEKMTVGFFIEDIVSQGSNLFIVQEVMVRIEEFLALLSESERERVLRVITEKAPALWLLNPKYVLEHNVMAFEELVAKTSANEYEYIQNLEKLIYHAKLLDAEGGVNSRLIVVMQSARKIVEANPSLLLDKGLVRVVGQIFDKEERLLFIANHLRPPIDSIFFGALLASEEWRSFHGVCHDLLLSEPTLFADVSAYREKDLYNVLSRREVRELVLINIAHVDLEYLSLSDQFKRDLISHATYQQRFLDRVVETGNAGVLVEFLKRMEFQEIKNWENAKKQIQENEQRIREYQERLQRTDAIYGETRVEIKKKIAGLIESTTELKKQKYVGDIDEIKRLAREFERVATERLRGVVEKEKFFVFKKGVLGVLGEQGREIARREIEEYVKIYPEVLVETRLSQKPRLIFREVLGDEAFSGLFRSHIKTLVFWRGKYRDGLFELCDLPVDLQQEVVALNPFFETDLKDHLSEDYYAYFLQKLALLSFFPLFEERLSRIAKDQLSLLGPQTSLASLTPNEEFRALANTLLLLESSSFARRHKDSIIALPSKEREEIISLFSFLSFYHLEEGLVPRTEETSLVAAQSEAREAVTRFLKQMFEVKEDLGSVTSIPIQVVRALSTYYNKSCREHASMNRAFKHAVTPIIKGNYVAWRMWGIDGEAREGDKANALERMKTEKLIPNSLSGEQYGSWVQEESTDFSEVFSYQISDVRSGIRDVLSLAVIDQHVEKDALEVDSLVLEGEYEQLVTPLREMTVRQQTLRATSKTRDLTDEEREEYEELKQKIQEHKEEHEEDFLNIQAQQYLARLKDFTLEELEAKTIFLGKKKISLSDVFKTLQGHFKEKQDFLSDIQRIRDLLEQAHQNIFGGEKVSRSRLVVSDEVDLETHVLIGEKPVASCQHYDGSELNFGLLSYISDPGVKIIQVRDEQRALVARAVLRMVEDGGGQPQLFMERVYSVNTHPKIKEVMVRFALRKAESLGIKCYTHEGVFADMFEMGSELTILHNRGSRSPYVYTDAGGGRVPDGVFSMRDFDIVQKK